jgi:HEAT repeat protein
MMNECGEIGHTVDSIRRGATNCDGNFAAVVQTEAAATEALHALGDAVVPALEPLTRDPDARIRTAAVQVLIRLGRETWLEEELLA